MRKFLIFGFLVLIGGAFYGAEREGSPREPDMAITAQEVTGIRQMLRETLDLAEPVIGRAEDDLRDFRGRLAHDGRLAPAFGQARRLCIKGLDNPACWTVAYLEVDGIVMPTTDDRAASWPAGAAETAAAKIDPVSFVTASPEPELIETGDLPVEKMAMAATINHPRVNPTLEVPSPRPSEPERLPAATHLVARPVINARAGPGTDHPVVGRLGADARLSLLTRRDGWGRFTVLDGSDAGETVWVALKILEPLAEHPAGDAE